MTLQDLIDSFRDEADDKQAPQLWSDSILTLYANEGQMEAVRRSRLIVDASDPTVCTYSVAINDQKITLDPRVIMVRDVRIASKTFPLKRVHRKDIDKVFPGWDSTVNLGDVIAFVPDKETGKVWFNSPFPAADTVTLDVLREPLNDMRLQVVVGTNTTTAIGPEIQKRYHFGIVNWMLHRAFGKQDSETNDPEKAKNALDAFELEFGKKLSAQDEAYRSSQYGYDDHDGSY